LVIGEQSLGFLAQPARFVQLALDAQRALVERADERPAQRFPHPGDKDRHRQQYPEFRIAQQVVQHQRTPPANVRSTASVMRAASGAVPVSFSTTARPTSTATPRISASASSLLAAMRCSAAAICCANASASARWRSAATAAIRSAVSLIVAWASV